MSNHIVQIDGHKMGVQSCGADWANVFFVASTGITTYCEVSIPALVMEYKRWYPYEMSKDQFAELLHKNKDALLNLVDRLRS